ncbi:MAG: NADH-quinone oxidoreductase subunit M [Pseudomonadota bacterium]
MDNLLSIVTFLPLLAALILAIFLRGDDGAAQQNAKILALVATGATFVISVAIVTQFEPATTDFQLVERFAWVSDLSYAMGVDGVSLVFVMLTTALMPFVVGAAWTVNTRVKEFMILLLAIETLLLAAFLALDLMLFFVAAEAVLIPVFLLIAIWGGAERLTAAFKYALLALISLAALLTAVTLLWTAAGTTDMGALLSAAAENGPLALLGDQYTAVMALLLGAFAVKLALWPAHVWLPQAMAQAPTGVTVLLSAVTVKLGAYGLLRLWVPLGAPGMELWGPYLFALALAAILFGGLMALVQEDLMRLLAYAGVAQMGFVALGVLGATRQAIDGALFAVVAHAIAAAGLLILVGALRDRVASTQIENFGGLVVRMPVFAVVFMIFVLGAIGLPGTAGFVGVVLVVTGVFPAGAWVAILGALGLAVAAAYGIRLYRRVVAGDLIREALKAIRDLDRRELTLVVPLIALTLALGIAPSLMLDLVGPTTEALAATFETAAQAETDTATNTSAPIHIDTADAATATAAPTAGAGD